MDPISAFSLACNVLQVVELSLKAARVCKEIYETGSLEKNDGIEKYSTDLRNANKELKAQLDASTLSPGDIRLKRLCSESTNTATEISTLIGQLKLIGKQNVGRSLLQAIKALSKRKPIEKLIQKLDKQDKVLNSVILKELFLRCRQADIEWERLANRLDDNQRSILQALDNKIDRSEEALIRQSQSSQQAIVTQIKGSRLDNDRRRNLLNFLEMLRFGDMTARQNAIQQRVGDYGKTYEWIFVPGSASNHRLGSVFADWLCDLDDGGMFWITGKPGSGKSTLMNYIYENLQDSEADYLPKPPDRLVLRHYFFRPNNIELQQSFEGFLRTISYQLLASGLDLITHTSNTPRSMERIMSSITSGSEAPMPLLLHDLEKVCDFLLRAVIAQGKIIYLLVDGIDEMVEEQQESFMSFLVKLEAGLLPLRVCCSARAEARLQPFLHNCKQIPLHDLNYNDMQDYCDRTLAGTPVARFTKQLIDDAQGFSSGSTLLQTT